MPTALSALFSDAAATITRCRASTQSPPNPSLVVVIPLCFRNGFGVAGPLLVVLLLLAAVQPRQQSQVQHLRARRAFVAMMKRSELTRAQVFCCGQAQARCLQCRGRHWWGHTCALGGHTRASWMPSHAAHPKRHNRQQANGHGEEHSDHWIVRSRVHRRAVLALRPRCTRAGRKDGGSSEGGGARGGAARGWDMCSLRAHLSLF